MVYFFLLLIFSRDKEFSFLLAFLSLISINSICGRRKMLTYSNCAQLYFTLRELIGEENY